MYDEQLKRLWKMRFQKIFQTEKDSFLFYRELLRKNRILLRNTKVKELIKQLMREEVQHARMARELLKLVDKQIERKKSRLSADEEIVS